MRRIRLSSNCHSSVNKTHCNVYNFLPSVSSAIGGYSPQKEVWTWAIFLHAVPRLCIPIMYFQYNSEALYPRAFSIMVVASFLNTVENIALIVLSFYTSSDNYPVHRRAFITFIICSELYMLLLVYLHTRYRKYLTEIDKVSLNLKKKLVFINIISILVATYCFIRHNSSCEDYVYSFFAFCEYIVVLTNMAFHMTAALDFKNRHLHIYKCGVCLSPR
ncbi:post-GPI attachment to proteins factor 2 isoform X2 [Onthophagus taurus]|uniref:post-GPI attachment to proteins factor 2 isoform X2 n=1 Tax=Onthophagus taurus TaxID=166361 RepID=UPI000C20FB6C|nr:post-GPI attachment to proteins factor 2 isoform X2 [Onthophagus taurus]